MFCNECGGEIPDGSRFCSKCGAGTDQDSPATEDAFRKVASQSGQPEVEQTVWQGRPSAKGMAGLGFMLAVIIIALIVVSFVVDSTLVKKWVIPIAVLAVFLFGCWKLVVLKYSKRYRLSTQRFFIERGILGRNFDEIELIRVDDVSVKQGLFQRLLQIGDVVVTSTDSSDPTFLISSVAIPQEIKEHIRKYTRQQRDKRALHIESL